MPYECLNEYVVVRREVIDDSKTEGGIYKPETSQQRSNKGTVVYTYANSEVHPGDVVVFTKYGGTEIELDGEQFVLVHRKQIFMRDIPKAKKKGA